MHKFRFNSLFLSMLFAGIFIFSSCQSNHNKLSRLLNKDSLFSQSFQIDNSKDTLLHTANGALIKIAAGSFKQDKVALEVKEAYSIPQMILGGLTTSSDGKPLSSGGMIY